MTNPIERLASEKAARTHVVQNQALQADGRDHPCPKCPRVYQSGAGLGGHMAQHTRQEKKRVG